MLLTEQLEQMAKDHDSTKAELASVQGELASVKESLASVEAEKAKALARNEELGKSVEAKDSEIAEAKAETEKIKSELAEAKVKLADPAFKAVEGESSEPVAEGGQAKKETEMTYEEAHEKYVAIKDLKERADFRNAHRKELRLE